MCALAGRHALRCGGMGSGSGDGVRQRHRFADPWEWWGTGERPTFLVAADTSGSMNMKGLTRPKKRTATPHNPDQRLTAPLASNHFGLRSCDQAPAAPPPGEGRSPPWPPILKEGSGTAGAPGERSAVLIQGSGSKILTVDVTHEAKLTDFVKKGSKNKRENGPNGQNWSNQYGSPPSRNSPGTLAGADLWEWLVYMWVTDAGHRAVSRRSSQRSMASESCPGLGRLDTWNFLQNKFQCPPIVEFFKP